MKNLFVIFYLFTSTVLYSQNYRHFEYNPYSKDWTVVWGDRPNSKYGASFMERQADYSFEYENVFFADYNLKFEIIKILISDFCKDPNIVSVYGFGRGAVNAYELVGEVDFVGLIDPFFKSDYLPDFSLSKVFMLYNTEVWNKKNKKRLLKVVEILGTNNSKRLYMPHSHIPKLFFEKYKRGRNMPVK